MKKWIKRISIGLLSLVFLVIGSAVLIGSVYEKEATDAVLNKLGEHLKVPVGYGEAHLSLIQNFPSASIEITNINVPSLGKKDPPLLQAKRIYLLFDVTSLFADAYTINEVILEEGQANVILDKKGEANYNIWKSDSTTTSSKTSIELEQITLRKMDCSYTDRIMKHSYAAYTKKSTFSPKLGKDFLLDSEVELDVKRVSIPEYKLNESLRVEGNVQVSVKDKLVGVSLKEFEVEGEVLEFNGDFKLVPKGTTMNMTFSSKGMQIDKVKNAIPKDLQQDLGKLPDGNLAFNGSIKGNTFGKEKAKISINYNLQKGKWDLDGAPIKNMSLKGNYSQPDYAQLSTSVLKVDTFTVNVQGNEIKGSGRLINLETPVVSGNGYGTIDLKQFSKDLKDSRFESLSGSMTVQLSLKGKLEAILASTEKSSFNAIKTSGSVLIKDVNFKVKDNSTLFKGINGDLAFDKRDLKIKNLYGTANKTDFRLIGKIAHPFETLFGTKPFTLVADLFGGDMVLEDFIGKSDAATTSGNDYEFNLPKDIDLRLNVELGSFAFRKFKASKIKGKVKLKEGVLKCTGLNFNSCDGIANIDGTINAKGKVVVFELKAKLKKVNTQKAFFQLENFGQDFLKSEHVAGRVNTEIYFLAHSDKQLNLIEDKIYSETKIKVLEGELINFPPLIELQGFLAKEGFQFDLKHLKFKTLKNEIQIINKVIYIPEMKIRSNSVNFDVQGQHSFDQNVKYKLKIKHSEIFKGSQNAIEKEHGVYSDKSKSPTEPILMTGHVDDLNFAYDIKEKGVIITQNLKNEGKEIKNILKKEVNSILGKKDTTTTRPKGPPVKMKVEWNEEEEEEEGSGDDF